MLVYDESNLESRDINIFLCDTKKSPSHSHDFLELAYVVKGKAVHILNDAESIISEGDYFILDYNSQHSYYSVNGCEFAVINCLFKPEFIDKSLDIFDNEEYSAQINRDTFVKYNLILFLKFNY